MSFPLLDEWIHYTATWKSATGETKLYLNGELVEHFTNFKTGIEIGHGGILIVGQVHIGFYFLFCAWINSHVIATKLYFDLKPLPIFRIKITTEAVSK